MTMAGTVPYEAPAKLSKMARKDAEQDLQKTFVMAAKDSQARYDVMCNRMAAKARRPQGNRFAILAEEDRAAARRGHHD